MKIGLISNCFGIFVEKFVEEMEKNGADFSFKCIMKGVKGKKKSLPLKIYGYAVLHFCVVLNFLFKRFDILYVHFPLQTAPLIYFLSIISSKKIIINFHGSDLFPKTKFAGMLHFFTKKVVKVSNLIVVPSDSIRDAVIEKFNVEKDRVFISASSGIDFGIFNKELTKTFKKRRYAAGFISRIDTGKGWDTFIHSISELKKSDFPDDRKFLMIGNGLQNDDKEKLIKSLELEDSIDIKGRIERKDLKEYYSELGVFIFPSLREGLGLVGLESMACGVPVIGSKTEGISSYVKDGVNGYFFEPGNPKDLAEKINNYFGLSQLEIAGIEENAYNTACEYEQSRVGRDLYNKIEQTVFLWK